MFIHTSTLFRVTRWYVRWRWLIRTFGWIRYGSFWQKNRWTDSCALYEPSQVSRVGPTGTRSPFIGILPIVTCTCRIFSFNPQTVEFVTEYPVHGPLYIHVCMHLNYKLHFCLSTCACTDVDRRHAVHRLPPLPHESYRPVRLELRKSSGVCKLKKNNKNPNARKRRRWPFRKWQRKKYT